MTLSYLLYATLELLLTLFFFLYALPGCLFRFYNRLGLPPLQLCEFETSESWQHWILGNMLIKITFRKQWISKLFWEQGNCTVPQMSPDHNTPKGKEWLKRTTNYPRPQVNHLRVFLVLETFISLTHPGWLLRGSWMRRLSMVNEMTKNKSTVH